MLRAALGALLVTAASADAAWRLAGAEFNPVRTMPEATDRPDARREGTRWVSLSGTLRIADDPRRDELTVPISWSARRGDTLGHRVDLLSLELDVQYRLFLADSNHGGPYLGPLVRVSHRRGRDRWTRAAVAADRIGAGLVLGYRLPIDDGYHWDLSFSRGRFLDAGGRPSREPMAAAVATGTVFGDAAVLRFGRRF